MIYRLCLHRHQVKVPASRLLGTRSASQDSTFLVVRHTDIQDKEVQCTYYGLADTFLMSLLRVNRIIHAESAQVFYGENDFHCLLGIGSRAARSLRNGVEVEMLEKVTETVFERKRYSHIPRLSIPDLAPKYMAMIRRLHLYIELQPIKRGSRHGIHCDEDNYTAIDLALADLAKSLHGKHTLRVLSVRINTTLGDIESTPWENVYEPSISRSLVMSFHKSCLGN